MKGWHIFIHSVRLVLNNLGAALQVSLLLYLVQVSNQVVLFLNPPVITENETGVAIPDFSSGPVLTIFLLGVLAIVASLWIAVAWHRFVLKEEYPTGWLPRWHGQQMWGYFGRSILLGLIVMLAVLVASIPLGLITAAVPVLGVLLPLVIIGVAAYVFFRLCVMLPASAVGQRMTMGEAWEATKGDDGTPLVLAFLVIGASLLIQLPSLLNGDPSSVVNLVYGLVVNWFATVIGISVLTTLYGHYVEGRPID